MAAMTTPVGAAGRDAHDPVVHARITTELLSLDAALGGVTSSHVGGVGIFVGVVRDHDGGRGVTALSYSAHPTAEQALADTARSVAAGHEVDRVWVEHRTGDLTVGEAAVVVAVGAAHRGPALECCRELIDRLKAEVPIWKEQAYGDGGVAWVGV